MTDSIPEKLVKMIIALWLTGFTFREIREQIENKEQTRIAKSTKSNIVNRFLAGLSSPEAGAVKELAHHNKTSRIPPRELALLIRTWNRLSRAGTVDAIEDLDTFFTGLATLTKQPLEKIAAEITEMVKIAEMDRIPLPDVVAGMRQMLEERKDSELKLADAKKELSKVQDDIGRILVEAGLTKADIAELRTVREQLGSCGVVDIKKAIALVRTVAGRFHWDQSKVAAILNSLHQFDHRRTKLIQDISGLEARRAEMRDKDKLYDRVYQSGMTEPLWDSFEHKINMIAISQGKDKAIAIREAIMHFILCYDPFVGLLTPTIQLQTSVNRLKFKEKWLVYRISRLQDEIPALEKVKNDLNKVVDQAVSRLDRIKNEEKQRAENDDRLRIEEGNLRNSVQQLGNEITKRLEELARLNKEVSTKREAEEAATPPAKPKYMDVSFKKSGMVFFESGNTTLHSGHMASGFAPGAPPPS